MSEEKKFLGMSRAAFVAGILVAILVSSLISLLIVWQAKDMLGLYGEKGEQGPQGDIGPRGPEGPIGGLDPHVTASLHSSYTDVWLGTDYHDVTGLIINFGSNPAYNVEVKITWHLHDGGEHTEPATWIGTLSGHKIYDYSHRFHFEGSYDYITWQITWT